VCYDGRNENLKLTVLSMVIMHVYWMLVIGEKLVCEREEGNPRDQYAVAVKKSGNIIVLHCVYRLEIISAAFL